MVVVRVATALQSQIAAVCLVTYVLMAEVQRPCRKKPPWADLLDEDELRFENQHVILHDPVVRGMQDQNPHRVD